MQQDNTQPTIAQQDCDNPKMIEDFHFSLCLDRVVNMPDSASPLAALRYVENLLEQAKQTDDPVEALMLQQLVMAHHRVANLHVQAMSAKKVNVGEIYSSMAQRLLGEFRRLALALREYRTPATGKQTTVVHKVEQWNHAEGAQEVAYTKTTGPEGGVRMKARDSEQVSNDGQEVDDELLEGRERRLEESQAGCCGSA